MRRILCIQVSWQSNDLLSRISHYHFSLANTKIFPKMSIKLNEFSIRFYRVFNTTRRIFSTIRWKFNTIRRDFNTFRWNWGITAVFSIRFTECSIQHDVFSIRFIECSIQLVENSIKHDESSIQFIVSSIHSVESSIQFPRVLMNLHRKISILLWIEWKMDSFNPHRVSSHNEPDASPARA